MKIVTYVMAIAVWAPLAFLAGCANQPGMSGASGRQADMVTASDETEQRRRARLRLELAAVYFEQGQTTIALDEIKQAIATDPSFVDAYNVRGLVYMRLNDLSWAEDSFKRALSLNARDPDVAHNYGWLLCQQARYPESFRLFAQAIANPSYSGKARTLMTQGMCQSSAGQKPQAEESLLHSYEIDASNPVTGYHLAKLLYEREELTRSQFYIRRINNSELANSETLWLGIKIERKLNNREAVMQLADQLKKRFGQTPEASAYERGAFNE